MQFYFTKEENKTTEFVTNAYLGRYLLLLLKDKINELGKHIQTLAVKAIKLRLLVLPMH